MRPVLSSVTVFAYADHKLQKIMVSGLFFAVNKVIRLYAEFFDGETTARMVWNSLWIINIFADPM